MCDENHKTPAIHPFLSFITLKSFKIQTWKLDFIGILDFTGPGDFYVGDTKPLCYLQEKWNSCNLIFFYLQKCNCQDLMQHL